MVIKNSKHLEELINFINNNDKIAYDIETNGLNPRKDKIIGFGFSNAETGYYIVHLEWDGEKLVERVSLEDCKKVLELLKTKKWVGWNSSFEVRFTRHYCNIDLASSLHSEGMLAVHTVDENRMSYKLKDIGKELYGEDAVEEQIKMKESIKTAGGDPSKDYYMADADLLGEYCIQDCLLTYKIDNEYLNILDKEKLNEFYFKNETIPMYSEVIIDMEDKGINVDVDILKKAQEEIIIDINNLEINIQNQIKQYLDEFTTWYLNKELPPKRSGEFVQYLCKYAELDLPKTKSGKFSLTKKNIENLNDSVYKDYLLGGEYLSDCIVRDIQDLWLMDQEQKYIFNLSSKDHLKRLFFNKLNETPVSKTEKGNPQVDHLFLENMANKYDWVKDLVLYNKLNKILNTYYKNYIENSENGVFYPSWFMHRTTSGRLGGNLMQLPRQVNPDSVHPLIYKYNNLIRDCIVAGKGRKLVGADYSSLEVVVFADDAQDEKLLNMIRNNEDFYSRVYIDVFGLHDKYSADKKSDNFLKNILPDKRQEAKVYSLGLRYNMQSFKLSKTLDVSQEEAQNIIDRYFKSYSKLKERMDELINSAKKNGYVKSKTGRIRHLPMLKKLSETYGDVLIDSLELWKKYNDNPKKYKQMKYLGSKYRSDINNCLNFPIQSMAASITNRACIAINREFKRKGMSARVCMQIHDEIVVNCADHEVNNVVKIMQYLMENTTKLSVPLNAEPEVGDKYGELK